MMGELAGKLGWLVVWGVVALLLNFVLKRIYRMGIEKLPESQKPIKDAYGKVMRLFVRIHKPLGIVVAVLILAHFALMGMFGGISPSGLLAMVILLTAVGAGIYGAVHKNLKGKLLQLHRSCALVLAAAIYVHVFL